MYKVKLLLKINQFILQTVINGFCIGKIDQAKTCHTHTCAELGLLATYHTCKIIILHVVIVRACKPIPCSNRIVHMSSYIMTSAIFPLPILSNYIRYSSEQSFKNFPSKTSYMSIDHAAVEKSACG